MGHTFLAAYGLQVMVLLMVWFPACSSNTGVPQPGRVVISNPLLKRALSRREKHELLFEHATLALGHDKSLKQQQQQQQVRSRQLGTQLLLLTLVPVKVPELHPCVTSAYPGCKLSHLVHGRTSDGCKCGL